MKFFAMQRRRKLYDDDNDDDNNNNDTKSAQFAIQNKTSSYKHTFEKYGEEMEEEKINEPQNTENTAQKNKKHQPRLVARR